MPEWSDLSTTPPQAPQTATPSWSELSPTPPSESSEKTPDWNSLASTPAEAKYGTPGQQALAGLEGAAQGVAGPLATLAETSLLGVPKEDIAGRAEANPWTHGVAEAAGLTAGMLTGTGEAGLVSKGAEVAAKMAGFGKLGSAVMKGFLEGAAFQGSDEMTKAILGQGDPQDPVGAALLNIGGAGILGAVSGGVFNVIGRSAESALQAIENQKLSGRANSFLAGVGAAKQGMSMDDLMAESFSVEHPKDFDTGADFYNHKLPEGIASWAIRLGGIEALRKATGSLGVAIPDEYVLQKPLEKLLKKPLVGITKKAIMPVIGKALASNKVKQLADMLDYATKLSAGTRAATNGMDSLFKVGSQQTLNALANDDKLERDKDRIKAFVEQGGMNQQIQNTLNDTQNAPVSYAKGGTVESEQPSEFAEVFPAENMLLNAARGRVSGYLNSVRPLPPIGQGPFDKHVPSKEQEKTYDRALTIAARPMSVLKHVKEGTLTSEHVKHLSQMFPESYNYLSKEMTKRMVKYGTDEEKKPSFKTRQAMSLFLATPLEKSFSPAAIQAAQSVFMPKPQQPAAGAPKMKRGTAKLGSKTNDMYQTQSQESERDRSDRA